MTSGRALLSIALFAATFVVRAEPRAARESARDFFAAYASGDAHAAASFWSNDKAAWFELRARRTFHTRCIVVHETVVGDATVTDEIATVPIDALVTRWNEMPGASPVAQRERSTITLHRQDAGWRITQWRSLEDELAERLASLQRTERIALFLQSTDLHGSRLVEALSRRVVTLINQAKFERAAEIASMAWDLATALGDRASMARVKSAQSVLVRQPPRYDAVASREVGEMAIDLATQSRDPDALALALQRTGRAQATLGDGEAMTSFTRALALSDVVDDPAPLAHAASQLAAAFDGGGNVRQALRYAIMAAELASLADEPAAIVASELNLAGSYLLRGDAESGLDHLKRALAVAEKENYLTAQAGLLEDIATCELSLDPSDSEGTSKRFFETTARALELLGEDGNGEARLETLAARASALIDRNQPEAAEAELKKAATVLPENVKRPAWGDYHVNMARLRTLQGRYDEALAHFARTSGWRIEALRADVFRRQGRFTEERETLERAIRDIEARRTQIDNERHRTLIFPADVYAQLMQNQIAAGEETEALVTAERMKARVLKDLLAREEHDATPESADIAHWNARIEQLNRQLIAIRADGGNVALVRAELRRARGRLNEALAFTGHGTAHESRLDPTSISVPPSTTIIDYVAGKESITAFVVWREGDQTRIRRHTIAIGSRRLGSMVRDFVHTLEMRDRRYRADARRLYDLLLKPLLAERPVESLCLIPDGALWMLPFQALIDSSGKHLIERAPLFYAPALSLVTTPKPKSTADPAPTVLALGNPEIDSDTKSDVRSIFRDAFLGRLPDAEREVRELQKIYGDRARVLVGAEADESTLKRSIEQYDVVHLATHGIVDTHSPMYSALLLTGSDSEDGLLEAREIVSLPMRADLVVLSACDTARGKVLEGEGVMGLSWAILATGSPRVVATQWRIGSAAAARLMIGFHRRVAKQKSIDNVAGSLRDAQLEILRSGEYSHPYYWAAFALIGRD